MTARMEDAVVHETVGKETPQETGPLRKRGRPAKRADSSAEPTRAVNVPLSESDYRRLTMMKLSMHGESLKSIAARFIVEGLDRFEAEDGDRKACDGSSSE